MKKNIKLWTTFCSGSILLGCVSIPQVSVTTPLVPAMTTRQEAAQKEYQLGKQFHLQHQVDMAEEKYLYALELDPAHLGAQHALAITHASRGDLNRAIELLTGLANAHPDKSHIFANLGHAYFLRGDYKRAQEALDKATMLDPENTYAWNELELVIAAIKRSDSPTAALLTAAPVLPSGLRAEITELTSGLYKMDYSGLANSEPAQSLLQSAVQNPDVQNPDVKNTAVVLTPPSILPVEIINANGVPGLARQLRVLLPENAWKVIRMTNHYQFDLKTTRIEYREPDYAAALRLADHMGVHAEFKPNYRAAGSGLRVILGHDFRDIAPLRKRLACAFTGQSS